MNIDWSKAPEGATHYNTETRRFHRWMKLEGDVWFFHDGSYWREQMYGFPGFGDRPVKLEVLRYKEANDRDRSIKEICSIIGGADDDLDCAQRLFAAGYRKQVTP